MKTENDFNRFLSEEIKRLSPDIFYFKAADKYGLGVPDFLLWGYGYSTVFETKFIQEMPARNTTKLLKHTFKRTQQSFIKKIIATDNPGWGIIGCKASRVIYVINGDAIPESGNLNTLELQGLMKMGKVKLFEFGDIEEMILFMLNAFESEENTNDGRKENTP
jgi:hypothetical protein